MAQGFGHSNVFLNLGPRSSAFRVRVWGFDCMAMVMAAQGCRQHAGSSGSEFHVSFFCRSALASTVSMGIECLGSARLLVQ